MEKHTRALASADHPPLNRLVRVIRASALVTVFSWCSSAPGLKHHIHAAEPNVPADSADNGRRVDWAQVIQDDLDSDQAGERDFQSALHRCTTLRKKLALRRTFLEGICVSARQEYDTGARTTESLLELRRRLRDVEIELSTTSAERSSALKKYGAYVNELARTLPRREAPAKHADPTPLLKECQLEAEIALDREEFGNCGTMPEIHALQERARALRSGVHIVLGLYSAGTRGGEPEQAALLAREWCVARADLALASADKPRAITHLKAAVKYAEWRADLCSIKREKETDLIDAINSRAELHQISATLFKLCPECASQKRK